MVWIAALGFTFSTLQFLNDHFGRISPARQIVRYGELPFRDYFDPGYYLTELSSALMQYWLGDNLLGEAVLNVSFIATGVAVVFLLARRVTSSPGAAAACAAVALLAMPRAYDYDKVLFYPLGLLAIWRYAERPGLGRLFALGAVLTVAALYRYDSGVYLGAASLAGVLVAHRGSMLVQLRRVIVLMLAVMVLMTPVALIIARHGGIADAVDQMLTYGVRESEPLQLFVRAESDGRPRVQVRWVETVTALERSSLAKQFGLAVERPHGNAADRTWDYRVTDDSAERLRALVTDPRVEDTNGIDRQRFSLDSRAPRRGWIERLPRFRNDLFDSREAGVLFGMLWMLPVVAALILVRASPAGFVSIVQQARLWSVIVLCLLLDMFIMRPPVTARFGGMAGPPVLLGAWLLSREALRQWRWRMPVFVAVGAMVYALAVIGEWPRQFAATVNAGRSLPATVRALNGPGSPRFASGPVAGMAEYVRTCTTPGDHVYASWFAPDLYFFAQRPFAGRIVATFSAHWSDERFQRRSLAALQSQSVPVVLLEVRSYERFRTNYPMLDRYFSEAYDIAGERSFDDGDTGPRYRVLIFKGRTPAGTHPTWQLPCFS